MFEECLNKLILVEASSRKLSSRARENLLIMKSARKKMNNTNLDKSTGSCKPLLKKFLSKLDYRSLLGGLKDPRKRQSSCRWNFEHVMRRNFEGLLVGAVNLREIESLTDSWDYRIPDSSNYDILVEVDPSPLHEGIARQVKKALRAKQLEQSFPLRITAIDGKNISVSRIKVGDFSQKREDKYFNRALRAMPVSCKTKLILGQHMIPGETNESTQLLPFLDSLQRRYGQTELLDVISVDAGFASLENFKGITERGLRYIMCIKGNLAKLHDKLLKVTNKPAETSDVDNIAFRGKNTIINRRLTRSAPPDHKDWDGIKEVWKIEQTTSVFNSKNNIWEDKETQVRLFITNIETDILNGLQVLKAVRSHWAIENNGFFTLDYTWKEDDSPIANRALELVSLLRILAFNEYSKFVYRKLKKSIFKNLPWRRLFDITRIILTEFILIRLFDYGQTAFC